VIDLHVHSTASDGSLAPDALAARLARSGITTFALCDHDTTAGLAEAAAGARAGGLGFLPGIEITAVDDGRDVHVLGYGIDTASPRLRSFLETQREERLRRVREMGDRLEALGCPIDVAPILESAARGRSVGRPQIAAALLAQGYVATRDEAFDRFLEHGAPAYVARRGAAPSEVIAIVHEAGGVASLAHPGVLRRDELIARLAAAGLDGLEALHSDHDEFTEARYRALARELDLLVTGGSDFHGDVQHRATRFGALSMSSAELDALRRAADCRRGAVDSRQ
jgi:3',5'-nucleoside bisphosphate phosphatase